MSHAIAAASLGVAVLAAWIGAAGFLRLRTAYDRLHCATYVSVGAGLPVLVAACTADGLSDRALKLLFLVACMLLSGAALAHAIGRALLLRGRGGTRT